MKTIGENIAVLRKKRGLTQEALAATIGVAPQTISKWENNITAPDITLLPIIADIYRVSVDTLFGRGDSETMPPEQVLDKSCRTLLKVIAAYCYDPEVYKDQSLEEYTNEYMDYLKANDISRTGVFFNHGTVYYREKFGGMLLKRPPEGWHSLLENEKALGLLEMICDKGFRRVLTEIFTTGNITFTLNSVCRKCGIEDPEVLKEQLYKSGLFSAKQIEIDDNSVLVYELDTSSGHLSTFMGILGAAAECADYVDHYFNCCECSAREFID